MELLDLDRFRAQCLDQLTSVVRHPHQPRHPVRGTGCCGGKVIAVARRNHPLDLESSLDLQALCGRMIDKPLQQQPVAAIMRFAVLPVPITRRPGPPRLGGQRDQPPHVRNDTKITDRCSAAGRGGQPVVEAEIVEAGRGAHAPGGQVRQPPHGNALHAGDAGIVDEGRRHHADPALNKGCPYKLLSLRGAGLPLGDVHGTTE